MVWEVRFDSFSLMIFSFSLILPLSVFLRSHLLAVRFMWVAGLVNLKKANNICREEPRTADALDPIHLTLMNHNFDGRRIIP